MKVKEYYEATNLKPQIKESTNSNMVKHNNEIFSTFYYDDQEEIKSLQIFAQARVKGLGNQVDHTIKLLKVIQEAVINLCEVTQAETNDILKRLGLFNSKVESNQTTQYDYLFKVEYTDGLLLFSIAEI